MRKLLLLLIVLPTAICLKGQSVLSLSPGANLFIGAGTTFAADGLALTPAVDYNITGDNSLTKAVTLLHPSNNIFIKRVYQWNATLPAFTGNVAIYYNDAELSGLDENTLTLNVHDGALWNAYINNVVRDGSNNFVRTQLTGVSLNELTLASISAPLPVQWLGVEAVLRNGQVYVNWRTANESNCAAYYVEKSSDGITWNETGKAVPAYNRQGPNYYGITDNTLPNPVSYYRIRQTDLDGRYTYSAIVWVKAANTGDVLVYPVPARNFLTIAAPGRQLQSVQLFDAAGRLVQIVGPGGLPVYNLNVQSLAAGRYTAVIVMKDQTIVTRAFLKQ